MRKLFTLLILVSCLFSCEELIPDLPRDNPRDNFSGGDDKKDSGVDKEEGSDDGQQDGVKLLEFKGYEMACKKDGFSYTTESSISSGDHVWLRLEMRNSGSKNISKIRAKVSSNNSAVEIIPISNGRYIKFTESTTDDYINGGKTGWAEIIDGSNSYYSAPNHNSYGVEFIVSDQAMVGEKIKFTIDTSDAEGDKWSDSFEITIK